LRGKEDLFDAAVGNVLQGVEVLVVGGDFDAAFPARRAVEVQGARIIECAAVNSEVIVVKTLVERLLCHSGPDPVITLGEFEATPLNSAQAYANHLGIGRFNPKPRKVLGVHFRKLLAGLIYRRRGEIVHQWLIGVRGGGTSDQKHEGESDESHVVPPAISVATCLKNSASDVSANERLISRADSRRRRIQDALT
jgi:hypothetical protein